jgi:hypothetical protein
MSAVWPTSAVTSTESLWKPEVFSSQIVLPKSTVTPNQMQTAYTYRIKGFSDFVHRPDSKELEDKNTTFRKLDLFQSSDDGRALSQVFI